MVRQHCDALLISSSCINITLVLIWMLNQIKIASESQTLLAALLHTENYQKQCVYCPSSIFLEPQTWESSFLWQKESWCVLVFVNEHKGIFAHPHAQIHGDVLEKGRNVTDRAREEQESSSSLCFSSLLFSLFFFFLRAQKKNSYKTQPKQRSCAGEDRNQREPSCDYKGLLQSALKSQRKKRCKQEKNSDPLLLQIPTSVSPDVSVEHVWQKLRFCLHLMPRLLLLSPF